jgi:hypothetical protein
VVDGFVPLARTLRAHVPGPPAVAAASAAAGSNGDGDADRDGAGGGEPPPGKDARRPRQRPAPPSELASLALVRLAAREAFERAAARVLEGLAHDVLGRELRLAPADIEALVARARVAFENSGPVAIEVSAADALALAERAGLPVRIDPALGPGDVVVRVRDGAFESPLAFRLAGVLADAGTA